MRLLFVFVFLSKVAFGQVEKNQFIEANIGLASIDDYSYTVPFPGARVLYGQTYNKKSFVIEWQIGLAAPSVVTGKIGIGAGNLKRNFMIAVRPWPLSVGPQAHIDLVKLGRLTLSFEIGNNNDASYDAGFISTVGWRWIIKSRKQKLSE